MLSNGNLSVGQAIASILPNGTLSYLDDLDEDAKADIERVLVESARGVGNAENYRWLEPPVWPTDLFATAAYLAHCSGLLTFFDPNPDFKHAGSGHPISFAVSSSERANCIAAGQKWSTEIGAPAYIYRLWRKLIKAWDNPLRASSYATKGRRKGPDWWNTVIQLIIATDEACVGLGAPPRSAHPDRWLVEVFQQFYANPFRGNNRISNVGHRADRQLPTFGIDSAADIACVQPKNRTASVGCNLRNLSRNVTYLPHAGNVRCHWQQPIDSTLSEDADALDILIIPIPLVMESGWIKPSGTVVPSKDRPEWGNFEIEQGWLVDENKLFDFVEGEMKKAKSCAKDRNVNAVIFPEYALTEPLFNKICERLKRIEPHLEFAIAGSSNNCDGHMGNFVLTALWYKTPAQSLTSKKLYSRYLLTSRRKHHRWKLSGNQILDYDLTSSLDPKFSWWETHSIAQREIHFYHFRTTTTFTSMICEDLARSDPCHDIVRSVGPNLLFALLMDGPQRKNRWPARYAATLADDPGTAVLTVTSAGLMDRTNKLRKYPDNRVTVAMWRDETGEIQELDLEDGSRSLLLSLKVEWVIDQTLDGRQTPHTCSWRYDTHLCVPS